MPTSADPAKSQDDFLLREIGPELALQALLDELVAPVELPAQVTADSALSVYNKVEVPGGTEPAVSTHNDQTPILPVCSAVQREFHCVKTTQFYNRSRSSNMPLPIMSNSLPIVRRTVRKSRKPTRLDD